MVVRKPKTEVKLKKNTKRTASKKVVLSTAPVKNLVKKPAKAAKETKKEAK
jgi:hypothetical protein